MSGLSKGALAIYPFSVRTEKSLEDVRDWIIASQGGVSSGGLEPVWGSVEDSTDLVGEYGAQPKLTAPGLVSGDGTYPDRLQARLFWYEYERKTANALPAGALVRRGYILRATDFIFIISEPGEFLVLATTRTDWILRNIVFPEVISLFASLDEDAVVYPEHSSLALGDSDFFLWLLSQFHSGSGFTPDLVLDIVRSVNTADVQKRVTSVGRGADPDRLELLALMGIPNMKFGPASFSFRDLRIGLRVDITYFEDGGFTVRTSESFYVGSPVDRVLLGPRIVDDLVHICLPEVRTLYNSDSGWRSSGRTAFRSQALAQLQKATSFFGGVRP